jgi:outer membrane lipoprotein-sorting protein
MFRIIFLPALRLVFAFALAFAGMLTATAGLEGMPASPAQPLKAKKVDPPSSSSTRLATPALSEAPGSTAPPVDGAPAVVATPAAAEPTTVSAATLSVLNALEAKNNPIKTVHATFDQTRYDEVFLEKVDSQGELWFDRPDNYRCDYNNPQPMTTLITGNALYMYVPELKQVDYWKFASKDERDAQVHHLLLAFGFKTSELLRHYLIQSSEDAGPSRTELGSNPTQSVLLLIAPRAAYVEATPFSQLKVWIDKASLLPQKIWYKDRTGASMTLTMKQIEFDKPFADKLFDPKAVIPAGTKQINKRENP